MHGCRCFLCFEFVSDDLMSQAMEANRTEARAEEELERAQVRFMWRIY